MKKQSFQKNAFDLEYRRYKILSRLLQFKERKDCFVVVTSINEFELIRVADKKINPVRHWVLQVREFCQTYQLFARLTFFFLNFF